MGNTRQSSFPAGWYAQKALAVRGVIGHVEGLYNNVPLKSPTVRSTGGDHIEYIMVSEGNRAEQRAKIHLECNPEIPVTPGEEYSVLDTSLDKLNDV